jgi:hypothetical protein
MEGVVWVWMGGLLRCWIVLLIVRVEVNWIDISKWNGWYVGKEKVS